MVSKKKSVDFSAILDDPESVGKVTADIKVVIEGAPFVLKQPLAQMAREGFIFIVKGQGKFVAMEVDISAAFDAPGCYVTVDGEDESDGYKALRETLKIAYPGYSEAAAYIASKEKGDAEARTGGTYNAALGIKSQGDIQVRKAIGIMYQAWKTRTETKPDKREQDTPDEYMRDTVRSTLKGMAAPRSKQVEADKRRARYWMNVIDAVFTHPKEFEDIISRTSLGIAVARDKTPQKPSEVTKHTPEQIAAMNAAAQAVIEAAAAKLLLEKTAPAVATTPEVATT